MRPYLFFFYIQWLICLLQGNSHCRCPFHIKVSTTTSIFLLHPVDSMADFDSHHFHFAFKKQFMVTLRFLVFFFNISTYDAFLLNNVTVPSFLSAVTCWTSSKFLRWPVQKAHRTAVSCHSWCMAFSELYLRNISSLFCIQLNSGLNWGLSSVARWQRDILWPPSTLTTHNGNDEVSKVYQGSLNIWKLSVLCALRHTLAYHHVSWESFDLSHMVFSKWWIGKWYGLACVM